MIKLAFVVFLVLHGLVHVWYVVLSQGWIEVEEQMGWNGHSWLLSSVLSTDLLLAISSVLYVTVTLGFIVGAAGLFLEEDWSRIVLVGAAVLSTIIIVVMWDGKPTLLVEKGLIGVLLNLGIISFVFLR